MVADTLARLAALIVLADRVVVVFEVIFAIVSMGE